jgi:hypothetical protein
MPIGKLMIVVVAFFLLLMQVAVFHSTDKGGSPTTKHA